MQNDTLAATATPCCDCVDSLTPEIYGAVGDGIADDSNALRDAVNAATTEGKILFGRPGATYHCATAPDILLSRRLVFDGRGCRIVGPGTGTFLRVVDHDIRNVVFDNFATALGRTIANGGAISHSMIADCEFLNMRGVAVYFDCPYAYSVITNSVFHNGTGGYCVVIGTNVQAKEDSWHDIRFTGNVAHNISGTSATSAPSTALLMAYGCNFTITGNHATQLTGPTASGTSGECYGIYTKLRHSVVSHNIIEKIDSTTSGDVIGLNIKGEHRVPAGSVSPRGFGNIVSHNNIREIGAQDLRGYGIRLQSSDVDCSGNYLEDTGVRAICIDNISAGGGNNINVNDNLVRCTHNGLFLGVVVEACAENINIADNVMHGVNLGVKISPANPSRNIIVQNNLVESRVHGAEISPFATIDNLLLRGNEWNAPSYGVIINGGQPITKFRLTDNNLSVPATPVIGSLPVGTVKRDNLGYPDCTVS